MKFASLKSAAAALALVATCGSAHAFSARGNYDVTFAAVGGGGAQYCVNLTSQGANGPYRDVGSATFYAGGSPIATGTYVVFQHTIAVAVITSDHSQYLTASGTFASGQQAFNTAAINFENNATIIGTATFQYKRNGGSCAKSSD